jgi:two-component system response regulator AtoC
MKDENKAKEELLNELSNLRRKISKLEKSKTHYKKIEEELKKHQEHLEELVKRRTIELEEINKQLKNELAARKKTEEALRESENMYKTLMKTSPDAVNIIDLNGHNIEASQRMVELFGYDNEHELLGKYMLEGIPQEDHEKAKMLIQAVLKKGFIRNIELTFMKKDGKCFIGETNAALIKDITGKPKAIIGTIRDITERKKVEGELRKHRENLEELVEQRTAELARTNEQLKHELTKRRKTEEALRESEEMYKTLFMTSPDAVGVCGLDGTYIEASERAIKLLGLKSTKEFIGRNYYEFIAQKDHEKVKKIFHEIFEKGFIKNIEITFLKKNGTSFIAEANAALVKDAYGKPKAIIGILRDITERKNSEEALRESEELYRKLITTSPDIVAVSDLQGILTDVSEQTVKLFGYKSAEELIGQNGFNLIAPEGREKILRNAQIVRKEGFSGGAEYIAMKKNGTRFILETNAALVKDAHGKPKAFISTSRDITERKRMEEELKKYREHLEQLVEERTRELLKTQKEVKTLRKQILQGKKFPEIIGKSPKILQILDLVQQVARTNSTVLIYGETGSGKDLIAKAIHFNSARKDGAFLAINCAALPEQLIESELFGYVKGAFTGANQDKKGLFEEAEKGTIFLNEISEMPIKVQAKLLHAIENQQVRRLGQSRSIIVNVRIIAASNIDLEQAVEKGTFREDLFYRLSVFPITIPPLRDRKEDIPLLFKHFLDKYNQLLDKHVTEIYPQAMDTLFNYSYPGNVRELENIIQRAIIMAQGSILLPQYLPDKLRGIAKSGARANLAEIEKDIIINVIHQCKGDLDQAAKQLGYSRTTLWRRMKKLGINL